MAVNQRGARLHIAPAQHVDREIVLHGCAQDAVARERVPRSAPLYLCQRRLGLWQLAHPRHSTCGVAGVGSTSHKLFAQEACA
jgi:hypothetical protein